MTIGKSGLAADKPRNKQGFFRSRIKIMDYGRLAGSGASRSGKAGARQRFEAFLGLQKRFRIVGVEIVSAVAGVIHHDLSCHC